MNYTIYYPLTEKYLSLYPQEKKRRVVEGHNQKAVANSDDDAEEDEDKDVQTSEEDRPAEKGEKPPMWDIVKQCMADKTLDKLRDGKLNIGFDGKPLQSSEGTISSNIGKDIGKEKMETMIKEKERKRKREDVEAKQPKEDEEEDSDGGFFEE